MTTEQDIEAALDRGDVAAAALLAASLPRPQDYLDAMQRVHAIVANGMKRKPMHSQFSLEEKLARVTHFETDKRASDDPTKDAPTIAVVSFALTLPSEFLAGFSPTLRAALFHKNGAVTHDLANTTQEAPDLRFEDWIYPIKIKKSWEGAEVVVHRGLGGKSDLVLPEAAISTFHVTPKSGGIFILEFIVRSKPETSTALGKLADMVKTDQTISLSPPQDPAPEDGDGNPKQAAMV